MLVSSENFFRIYLLIDILFARESPPKSDPLKCGLKRIFKSIRFTSWKKVINGIFSWIWDTCHILYLLELEWIPKWQNQSDTWISLKWPGKFQFSISVVQEKCMEKNWQKHKIQDLFIQKGKSKKSHRSWYNKTKIIQKMK